jgi:Putative MetA-pathway of phenol degradation
MRKSIRIGRVAHLIGASLLILAGLAGTSQAFPELEFCDDLLCCPQCREHKDPYEERIETERHDFTQSATTVGDGVVQLEAGYSFFYNADDGERETAHTGPETMLRLGLSDDIEFRLRWNYAWVSIDGESEESGAEDLRWSFKLQMTEQDKCSCVPTSALEINMTAPTGGEAFDTGRVGFGLDYIYQWELTENVNVAGSTGFATDAFGEFGLLPEDPKEDRSLALSQSAVMGLDMTENTALYVEWFGIFSHGLEDEFVVNAFDLGVDYYLSNNFVLDARAGVGLSNDADDFFTGVGGGYRF